MHQYLVPGDRSIDLELSRARSIYTNKYKIILKLHRYVLDEYSLDEDAYQPRECALADVRHRKGANEASHGEETARYLGTAHMLRHAATLDRCRHSLVDLVPEIDEAVVDDVARGV